MIAPSALLLTSCLLMQTRPVDRPPEPSAPVDGPATTAPATRPALELGRAEWRSMLEQELAGLPRLGEKTIGQVLSVDLEEGHLHVKPRLAPTSGMSRINITDWPGHARLMVGAEGSLMFNLMHTDLNWRDAVVSNTTVMTNPDYLQLNRDIGWAGDERTLSVTLIQSRQFADENDQPTRLMIQYVEVPSPDDTAPPRDRNVTLAAASFEQLRLAHPREVRTYLLPILRDLGASHLVRSTDPRTAWQVLGAQVPIDPAVQERINTLLRQIDADDFKARAAAEESLVALGPEAAVVASRMDLSGLSPDARLAVQNLVRQWQALPADQARQMAGDLNFLIDVAQVDDPRLAAAAVEQIRRVTGKPLELPATLSPEQRDERLEALRPPSLVNPATQPAAPAAEPALGADR